MLRLSTFAAAAAAAAILPGAAGAQDWPNRPVRIVVPFAAGGTADTWGRIVAEGLTESLKQQVFVENKPGGGGLTASRDVTKAKPDGYTLVISGIGSHVIAPVINENAGFDPMKQVTHIAMLGGPPNVFIASPGTNIKSLDQLIAYVKAQPKPVGYGSPGVGSNGHLFGEWFRQRTGIALEHISYKGAAPAVTDVVAGHVPFASVTLTTASGQVRSKTVAAIAVSSPARLPTWPDIPTFKELGYDIAATTWFALSGPPALDAALVDRINKEIPKVMAGAKVKEQLERQAMVFDQMTPAETTKFFQSEIDRWGPIAKAAGVKSE